MQILLDCWQANGSTQAHTILSKENTLKTSHKLFIATAATLPFIGLAGTAVHAATGATATDSGPMGSLIDKLATKFNLKSSDVKAVFEEEREAHKAEIQTKVSDALKTAGFTDAQITALQNKQKEQRESGKAWRDANPNATREEMKSHRDSEKTALEAWAKEQGIDVTKLREALKTVGVGLMGVRGGHGGPGMMDGGTPPTDAPAN